MEEKRQNKGDEAHGTVSATSNETDVSSPVVQGEDGSGAVGIGGFEFGFEFGVDPNEDPELALALKVSMEEKRQNKGDEAHGTVSATSNETDVSSPVVQGEDGSGAVGIGGFEFGFEFGVDPNEDPELALALKVSMEEQRQNKGDEAHGTVSATSNETDVGSPVVQGEDGSGAVGIGGMGFDFGVDPNEDPELALNVLRRRGVSDVDKKMIKNIEEFENNNVLRRRGVSDVDKKMIKNIEEFEKNILTWIKERRAMLERIKILQEKNTPEVVLHKASQTEKNLGVTDKESQTDEDIIVQQKGCQTEEVVVQVTEVKINAKDEFPTPVTLFVGNISEDFPDLLPHLFQQHGEILHWIQNKDENGKQNDFAYCEFKNHQSALKALKILHNYKWGDKKLIVKIADGKTEDSYQRSKTVQNEALPPILHGQNSPILARCINTVPTYPVSGAFFPSTDASLMSQQNIILKEVIQNISNQLDNIITAKQELEVKLANEKQKTNKLENTVDNLHNSYKQLQLQTRETIEEKTKLKKENTNLKLNHDRFEIDLKVYEVTTNAFKETYQKQEKVINCLKEKVQKLQTELHHKTVKESETFHEKQKAIEDVMELTLHLNEVSLYNSQLEQAETILKKKISTLTNEKTHLESQVQLLEGDYVKELDSMAKKYRQKYDKKSFRPVPGERDHKQEKIFEEKELEIRREEQEEKESLKQQLQTMKQKNKSLTRELEKYKKYSSPEEFQK